MHYKIAGAMRKSKKSLIVGIILWLFLTIVFVVPLATTLAWRDAAIAHHINPDISKLMEKFVQYITNPFETIGIMIENDALGKFLTTELVFTAIYSIFFFVGFVKAAPKNEYTDIEHGSSDWSKHGEQYQILNKDKGIILAENNYLPVDKRGNVNVLVVGRFRIW